jgi:D-lactate dehydrogenase (cytochrome)
MARARPTDREQASARWPQFASALAGILGADQIIRDPAELMTYERDAGLDAAAPDLVVLPRSAAEVSEIVRLAARYEVPVVARGGGTGLVGGAVAERGGLVISLTRMGEVEIDQAAPGVLAGPGVANLELDRLAGAVGRMFPPDPASGRTSTLGGNLATNAGGPRCFKYGVTTNYVTRLEVVLASGQAVWLGGQALDSPEYDLVGLMTGSEGTLGIVTRIGVRLVRRPPATRTLMASFESVEQAGQAVSAVIAAGLQPSTLEMMDRTVIRIVEDFVHAGLPVDAEAMLIVDVDGHEPGVDAQADEVGATIGRHGGSDIRVARSAAEREQIWFARKSAAGAFARLAPAYYLVDITVPRTMRAETLRDVHRIAATHRLRSGHVFHAGDGNLHPLIPFDPREPGILDRVLDAGRDMVNLAVARDGSITGEHGVGIEKREFMPVMYRNDELSTMRSVKRAMDPDGVFNPGKILPAEVATAARTPAEPAPSGTFAPGSVEEAAAGLAALSRACQPVAIGGARLAPGNGDTVRMVSTRLAGVTRFSPADLSTRWSTPRKGWAKTSPRSCATRRGFSPQPRRPAASRSPDARVRTCGRTGWGGQMPPTSSCASAFPTARSGRFSGPARGVPRTRGCSWTARPATCSPRSAAPGRSPVPRRRQSGGPPRRAAATPS